MFLCYWEIPENAGCHSPSADWNVNILILTEITISSSTYFKIKLLQFIVILFTILFMSDWT